MSAQATLFDVPEANTPKPKPKPARRSPTDWEARTRAFDAKKPEVYKRLVQLCREVRRNWPTRKVGIELFINKIRWEFSFDRTGSGEDFKINQNFARTYALMIEEREPDLVGMFEFRRLAKDRTKKS